MWTIVRLASIFMVTILALQGPANAAPEEKRYANLGKWRIVALGQQNHFQYCAAETDNGRVALRIATDGNTWQLGNPYYDKGPVKGTWGFDGWEDDAMFATDGDGWAVMNVTPHIMASLRRFDNFSIKLDRGDQHWSLAGASAALDKALECARNRGNSTGSARAPGTPAGISFVPAAMDHPMPRNAVRISVTPDGFPVYACLANYNNGEQPGTSAVFIEGCSFGLGGRELTVRNFKVMVGSGHWVRATNGALPANAIQAGHEADGRPLFVCRANIRSMVLSGKIRPGFKGCNIGDQGREHTIAAYEVLTQ